MTRSPLRLALALAAVLALSLLPLLSLPAAAAPAQPSHTHLSPPPPPPAGGHTYFYCNWQGNWIRLKHVPNVSVERFKDAVVLGKCKSLRTNDKYYKRLIGKNVNVFYSPKEYPGVFVVHNGRQGFQPVFGTWTFPISGAPSATLAGTVTDSASGSAIAGATVTAEQCVATPTEHCTLHTDVTNAKGQYTIQFFQFGKWKITATAGGYATGGSVTVKIKSGKNSVLNIALVRKPTDLTLTLGVTPTPTTVNSAETVSVTLSQPVSDGTVTFSSSGTATGSFSATTCTPSAGACSVTWTPSSPGTATISASWSGDNLYNPATNTAPVTVNGLSTTLALTASPSPVTAGQPVTLTATLGTAANGGTVTFSGTGPANAVFPTQTCTPSAGTCKVTWQASAPGTWNITASWSGAGAYGPATGTTSELVNPASATMTLTANPSSAQLGGQAVILTATLSVPANDGIITFTGTGPSGATFSQQSCTPSSGSCQVSWTPSAAGNWSITATWSGDAQYPNGAHASTQVAVAGGSIAISLTATPNPAAVNSPVTLKATLTQPVDDGSILFTGAGPNGATFPQKSCTPTNGTCSVTWIPPSGSAGQWQISAFWSGDAVYQNPVVTTIQVTVSNNAAALSVSANPNPVTVNHGTTITATLGNGATGGSIVFSGVGPNGQAATITPSSCAPTNGSCTATFVPPTNGQGNWTITANWSGTSQFAATSASTTVTVNAPGFFSITESPNPLQVNQTGTISATVQSAQTGQVTVQGTGPNGQSYTGSCYLSNQVSCTVSPSFKPTAIGTWTLSGLFTTTGANSQDYQDTDKVAVVGAPSTVSLQVSPNPPTVNQQTTITATVSPTVSDGTVTFSGSGPSGQAFTPTTSTCTPTNGVCTITWTPTAAGNWTITASWSGDSTYAPSPPKTITVAVSGGTITISSNPATPTAGDTVTLTATLPFNASSGSTITWSGTGPQGQDLTQYLSPRSTCGIAAGANSCSVTWTTDASSAGDWTITATWNGDTQHPSGDSTTTTITVQAPFFSLTIVPGPPEIVGTQVVAYAQLADSNVNDGSVTFVFTKPDNTPIDDVCPQMQGGVCQSDPITLDEAGQWTVTATWSGDTQYSQQTATTTFQVTSQ